MELNSFEFCCIFLILISVILKTHLLQVCQIPSKIIITILTYLSFPWPGSPILGIFALILSFLLSSISKFAQQRFRWGCKDRKTQCVLATLSKKNSPMCYLLEYPFLMLSFSPTLCIYCYFLEIALGIYVDIPNFYK